MRGVRRGASQATASAPAAAPPVAPPFAPPGPGGAAVPSSTGAIRSKLACEASAACGAAFPDLTSNVGAGGQVLSPPLHPLVPSHGHRGANGVGIFPAVQSLSSADTPCLGTHFGEDDVFLPVRRLHPRPCISMEAGRATSKDASTAPPAARGLEHDMHHREVCGCVVETNTSSETELCGDSLSLPVVLIAADSSSEDGLGECI